MIHTYSEAIEYLYSQMPVFHRDGASAYKPGLERITKLCTILRLDKLDFKTIHIAGTNGKGSVSHGLASVLQTSGYKTGLFTSPHLVDFTERVKVNGENIEKDKVIQFINHSFEAIQEVQPSFFELTTALALWYFKIMQVEIAVIETGLGGKLDSTNIISPILSVITNISYDHIDLLGDTLEKIAIEKAGIIKPNVPLVVGQTQAETGPIFIDTAQKLNSPVYFADKLLKMTNAKVTNEFKQKISVIANDLTMKEHEGDYLIDLQGVYQQKNILTMLTAIDQLKKQNITITHEQIKLGLSSIVEKTGLLGRWQVINQHPYTVLDTGHNEDGIRCVVEQLNTIPHNKIHIIFGMVADKDINKVLALLPKNATYYFTKAPGPRALNEHLLQQQAKQYNLQGNTFETVENAYKDASFNAQPNDIIYIGGSTYLVGRFLEIRKNMEE
ncbi:MAG TPA: folylpolyglutamate synthase/dihydrofolate synthase family protein [Bacteroidales bacterium]|nr:folylpolyglutamate synthase/dihydrofolate synthase family protein [Bacteroidales bacterium]